MAFITMFYVFSKNNEGYLKEYTNFVFANSVIAVFSVSAN